MTKLPTRIVPLLPISSAMQSRFARPAGVILRRADKFAQQKFRPERFVNNILPAKTLVWRG
jgi:hypothetical protein